MMDVRVGRDAVENRVRSGENLKPEVLRDKVAVPFEPEHYGPDHQRPEAEYGDRRSTFQRPEPTSDPGRTRRIVRRWPYVQADARAHVRFAGRSP